MIFILQQNDIQPTNHERANFDDANLLPPPPVPPQQRIFYSYLDAQNEVPEDQERYIYFFVIYMINDILIL
jgi:hypothetical protein